MVMRLGYGGITGFHRTHVENKGETMTKRKFFMIAACLVFSAVCVTGAFAQVTISGGLALSSLKGLTVDGNDGMSVDSGIGMGGNLLVDYLLPISIPLSLGGEVGFDATKFKVSAIGTAEDSIFAIPLLFRVAYHFDLLPKLDLYVVGKIGYVIGIWTGDIKDSLENYGATVDTIKGLGFGFDAGVAYYFNSKVGIFIEAGFDNYGLKSKIKEEGGYGSSYAGYENTLEAPFRRFLTAGFSFKRS
jgi:hypothetical protein